MANLSGYGTTVTPTMVPNYRLWFDDRQDVWVLQGKIEKCTVEFSGPNQQELLKNWMEYRTINNSQEIEPEFI